MIKDIKLFKVYFKSLKEKVIIIIIIAIIILKKKNKTDQTSKNIIKKETPPNKEPSNNLSLETLLFKNKLTPKSNIKSNKKLIRKI